MRNVNTARGERLQAWADERYLTVARIARELDVAPSTVRNWFSGIGEPRGSDALRLENLGRGFLKALRGPELPPAA
jgi:transcriptional regulator with XRE-family HTH domain